MKMSPKVAAWKNLECGGCGFGAGDGGPGLGAGVGALHGDHGQITAHAERGGRAGGGQALLHPGEILVGGAGVDDDAVRGIGEEVDDQVVDHAALLIEHAGIKGLAGFDVSLATSLAIRPRRKAFASGAFAGPRRSMCETSNMPASRRTAWCSSICEP
jgi:hypothetical protein